MEQKKLYWCLGILGIFMLFGTIAIGVKYSDIKNGALPDPIINMLSNTEYWTDEIGMLSVELRDYNYRPISAPCTFNILYPDKTYYIRNSVPTDGQTGLGTYYLNFQVPSITGVYEYNSVCSYGNKNYTTGKSFHVKNYLNEFEFEGQDSVRPGEVVKTGWRSLSGGRKISNANCTYPGNFSLYNNNESFLWSWYANPTWFRPGVEYNITCGATTTTPMLIMNQTTNYTYQLSTILNDTFDIGSLGSCSVYGGEGCNPWYNSWNVGQGNYGHWSSVQITSNRLKFSSSDGASSVSMSRNLNTSVSALREISFNLSIVSSSGGGLTFQFYSKPGISYTAYPYGGVTFTYVNANISKVSVINGVNTGGYSQYPKSPLWVDVANYTFERNQSIIVSLRDLNFLAQTYSLYIDNIFMGSYNMFQTGYSQIYNPYTFINLSVALPAQSVSFQASGVMDIFVDNFYLYSNTSDIYRYNSTTITHNSALSVPDPFSCFQEWANVTPDCSGLWYPSWANMSEGSYSETSPTLTGTSAEMFVNYTRPYFAVRNDSYYGATTWNVVWGDYNNLNNSAYVLPQACFNLTNGKLQLRLRSGTNIASTVYGADCWNGASWTTLQTYTRSIQTYSGNLGNSSIAKTWWRDGDYSTGTTYQTSISPNKYWTNYTLTNGSFGNVAIFDEGVTWAVNGSSFALDGNVNTCPPGATVNYANYTVPINTLRMDWHLFGGQDIVLADSCVNMDFTSRSFAEKQAAYNAGYMYLDGTPTRLLSVRGGGSTSNGGGYLAGWSFVDCYNGVNWVRVEEGPNGDNGLTCEMWATVYSSTVLNPISPDIVIANITYFNQSLTVLGATSSNVTLIDWFRIDKNLRALVAKG